MNGNGRTPLTYHIEEVKKGNRRFETAFQTVSRMILDHEDLIEKVIVQGKNTYNFRIFRSGKKHVVGMYDEINSFVSYVKDAAQGGSSREMAFVLVGERGKRKDFFCRFIMRAVSKLYRSGYKPQIHVQLQKPR